MSIEFVCPSCQQQLRVPDTAAGKNAKCPKCATILSVPGSSVGASPLAPPPQAGFNFNAPPAAPPQPKPAPTSNYPTSPAGSFAGPPPGSPFAGPPENPFAFKDDRYATTTQSTHQPQPFVTNSPNPYASPQGGYQPQRLAPPGMIGHQIVEVSPIVNYAIEIWKRNLGVLLGMTLLPAVIMIPFMLVMFVGVVATAPLRQPVITVAIFVISYLALIAMNIYLGIGQSLMCLKLARGQSVTIGELFSGGDRLLPTLGFALITTPIIFVAALPLGIPLIFLLLIYWPAHHLVTDGKCRVMESFSIAQRITEGNKLTTFVLVLVSYGFALLGEMACFVGLFFATPLIWLLWSSAYLMMSGQIPIPPQPQPYVPQQPYMPPQQPSQPPPQGYLPPPQK